MGRSWDTEKLFEKLIAQKYSKFDENYKLHIQEVQQSEHKKHEESYTKAYHNQIAQNPWEGETLKSNQRKKTNYVQRNKD